MVIQSENIQEQLARIQDYLPKGLLQKVLRLLGGNDNQPKYLTREPPNPPKEFTGRSKELDDVFERLQGQDQRLLIASGMRGIGKTTLALAYFHQHKSVYHQLAWIDCPNGLISGVVNSRLSENLGLNFADDASDEDRFDGIWNKLSNVQQEPNLLVLDNVNEASDIHSYISRLSNWHILVTSIATVRRFPQLDVKALSMANAKAMFEKYREKALTEAEEKILEQILEKIGFHTLTIELLAKQRRLKLASFYKKVENDGFTKAANLKAQWSLYRSDAEIDPRAIILEIFNIADLSDTYKTCLRLLAELPSQFIPVEHLDFLKDKVADYEDHIDKLVETGWLEADSEQDAVKLHQLVQEVIKRQNSASPEELDQICYFWGAIFGARGEGITLAAKLHYLPYAEYFLQKQKLESHRQAEMAYSTAKVARDTGRIPMAFEFAKAALSWWEMEQIVFPEGYIRGLLQIADLNWDVGRYQEAFTAYEKCKELLEQEFLAEPEEYLTVTYERLGRYHKALGQYEQALDYFKKDLAITERLVGTNPQSERLQNGLAISYSKLGDLYKALGQYEQALDYFKKYNEISERLVASNPQSENLGYGLGISYERLGDMYQSLGQFDKALDYFQKLEKLMLQLVEANPHAELLKNEVAISYSKLGDLYQALGQYEQALDYFKKYNEISERLVGTNPQSERLQNGLAISYSKLGDLYKALGQYEQALDYFKKRNEISERLVGTNPQSENLGYGLGISYERLGDINKALGKFEEALKYFQKLEKLMLRLVEANPNTELLKNELAISYEKLGDLYKALGQYEQSLDYFKKYNEISERLVGTNPQSEILQNGLAISYSKLGELYQALGQYEQALDYFKKRNEISERLVGTNPQSEVLCRGLAVSYSKLGHLYLEMEKQTLAFDHIKKALEESSKLYEKNTHSAQLADDCIYCNAWLAEKLKASDDQAYMEHLQTAKALATEWYEKTKLDQFQERLDWIKRIENDESAE